MAVRWKEGLVLTLRLRRGGYGLLQLLKAPYLVVFDCFQDDLPVWTKDAAQRSRPLFFCAVARQFLRFSPLRREPAVHTATFEELPTRWLKRFPGSSEVTVWPGTEQELSFVSLAARLGGQLVEKPISGPSAGRRRIIEPEVALDDTDTIERHELDVIWTYPSLNERIALCRDAGRRLDPLKALYFGQPLPLEWATIVDMFASRGGPEDWGYHSEPEDFSP